MNPREIPGLMRRSEIKWLSKVAKGCDLIVEIGTWFGRSTCAMGENVRGKIITIDSFHMEGVPSRLPLAREAIKHQGEDPDWIYHCCLVSV